MAKEQSKLPSDTAVDIEIDLGTNRDGYLLQARLNVSLPGINPEKAQAIVSAAHETCPYSKATSGNMRVSTQLITALPEPAQ